MLRLHSPLLSTNAVTKSGPFSARAYRTTSATSYTTNNSAIRNRGEREQDGRQPPARLLTVESSLAVVFLLAAMVAAWPFRSWLGSDNHPDCGYPTQLFVATSAVVKRYTSTASIHRRVTTAFNTLTDCRTQTLIYTHRCCTHLPTHCSVVIGNVVAAAVNANTGPICRRGGNGGSANASYRTTNAKKATSAAMIEVA